MEEHINKNKTAVLIANPVAGKASRKKLALARRIIEAEGFSLQCLMTEKRGDAETLARDSLSLNPDLFIIAGGDGTINEAINGLAGSNATLAIIPLGTANVLASELALTGSFEDIVKTALRGSPRAMCLGTISSGGSGGGGGGTRHFCLMAGAGFDAEAVYRVSHKLKSFSGKLSYVVSGLGVILTGQKRPIKVVVDGVPKNCHHAIISNIKKYAGYYTLSPGADISKLGFEVTLIRSSSGLGIVLFSLALFLGLHKRLWFVETVMGQEVSIEGETHLQIDGDYLGLSPAKISASQDMLWIVS